MPAKRAKLPEIYFDNRHGNYWLRLNCGRFLNLDSRNCKLHIMRCQERIDVEDDYGLKHGDNLLLVSQIDRWVDYAGPLSGHKLGLVRLPSGARVLVTAQAELVKAGNSNDCPAIAAFLQGLFGPGQMDLILYWLKTALASLERGDFRPGQLIVLAGPSGCGKSLFQALVTQLLGGRSAKPYRYMIGETAFNSDLAGAEHLVIEDENASADIRSRRKFGAAIKEFTVNTEISVHAKGRQAITLPTYKRLTLSVNNEPENLMILPPMDSSLLDKISLFKCWPAPLPYGDDRMKNWSSLTAQLPALVNVLHSISISPKWRDDRFGVAAWHHPEILEVIAAISPERRLENLIHEVLFKDASREDWEGTAEELEQSLRRPESGFGFAVDKLLYFSSACGVYLGRLAQKDPVHYRQIKRSGRIIWTINR